MRSVPHTRVVALFACVVAAVIAQSDAWAQGTVISLTTRRDMVFNHSGTYLYITTSDGWVRPYNLVSRQLEPGYNLGGDLRGADISPDDSFLLVAQGAISDSQGRVQKLNLQTGAVTNITYALGFAESGSFDVAIASNGLAFFTTIGPTPLYQIDLATNVVTARTDTPTPLPFHDLSTPAQLHRSADRTRLYIVQGDDSSGPVFTYSAVTNSFGEGVHAGMYFDNASAAVNRDGTLLGTLVNIQTPLYRSVVNVALDTAPGLSFVRGFHEGDSGIAFDAIADTLYAADSSTGEIIAYDTNTFAQKFRLNVGEPVSKGITLFGSGNMVASQDGRYLALATEGGIRVYTIPTAPPPPPGPTPTLSTRRDVVFDHAGHFVYITTSTGLVERYTLASGQLTIIADLGGSLNGADIAANDSFLLVAQNTSGIKEGAFQRVDLVTGTVTNINYTRQYPETGGFDIAIGSNGLALVTTRVSAGFSAWTPARQIDLATNAITIRTDVPGSGDPNPAVPYRTVSQDTQIYRNAAGSRFYFLEGNSSGGPIFTYDAVTNGFGPSAQTGTYLDFASAAVSRDGSLLATRHGYPDHSSLETAPNFNLIQIFGFDGGVALDAVTDTLYGVDSVADQIIAYDTNTVAEKYRLNIGEDMGPHSTPFDTGTLVASNDGRYLALETASGIRFLAIPTQTPPPSPVYTPVFGAVRDLVFDHSGQYLYITTAKGYVWPYNLLTSSLETPYDLGGSLNGADIAPDNSYLLVAQNDQGLTQARFQKLNLGNGAITNVNYVRDFTERGAWDVAIGSNGRAMVTTQGSGLLRLRQIDLRTNTISIRADPVLGSGFFGPTLMQRSADRTRICFFDYNISSRPVYSYSAENDTFGPKGDGLASVSSAVNRNGSLLGGTSYNQSASLSTLPNFGLLHNFSGLDHAVAFDAVQDVLYGISTASDQIIGYDTATFEERTRVAIGEDFAQSSQAMAFDIGTFVASPDGRYLALIAPSAVRVFDLVTGTSSAISTLPFLGNISTRGTIGEGENVPIGGFIVTGTDAKKVVVRAIGPSLAPFGVANALQDPILELHDASGSVTASNDNWRDSQATQIQAAGLAPSDDREAALMATLSPGSYTAVMRGLNGTTGVGVVELYDIDPNTKSKLGNISTRGMVGTGDNVMIAGFILGGGYRLFAPYNRKVAVRGLGPSLAQFGVPNALANPQLTVRDSNGTLIRDNDDWIAGGQVTELQNAGLAPTSDRESAIILALPPGSYTAILRGINNTSGVGLIEVYALP